MPGIVVVRVRSFAFIIGKLYVINLPFIFVIVKQQLISNHPPGSNIWFESGCTKKNWVEQNLIIFLLNTQLDMLLEGVRLLCARIIAAYILLIFIFYKSWNSLAANQYLTFCIWKNIQLYLSFSSDRLPVTQYIASTRPVAFRTLDLYLPLFSRLCVLFAYLPFVLCGYVTGSGLQKNGEKHTWS